MADCKLFISYRRLDEGYSGRLWDRLRQWFADDILFYDQAALRSGERFPAQIEQAVRSARVMLVVIGPEWTSDKQLNRLRENEGRVDFVRREVSLALSRQRTEMDGGPVIIPILMGGALMPDARLLPADVAELTLCTAHMFTTGNDADWQAQFDRLLGRLSEVAGLPEPYFRLPAPVAALPSVPALIEAFGQASRELLAWPTTLDDGVWLDRPELGQLVHRIESETSSVTLLLGEPGCGKSALLARLGQQLTEAGMPVLGIKLDYLPETVLDEQAFALALGLPDATARCVMILARQGKVVVLLDQLDALAELVVQHSGRLRVPLSLIRDLAEVDNVHVIASCRVFEQRHDPHLRHAMAETLHLNLPEWPQVDAVLQAHQVQANGWNSEMREVLRSPHALDIFLRLLATTDNLQLLHSYQAMLDELWRQKVLCNVNFKERLHVAVTLAERMAEREVLWLPLAVIEEHFATILELEAAGILVEKDGRVGFRHQTLYEFVRARSFLQGPGRLTEAVVSRQDSLRIRPQLWHALGYLRLVDQAGYVEEIRRLWAAELRLHLRMLMIEFLGQVDPPLTSEVNLFLGALTDPWRRVRILDAVVGNRGWFARLAGSLPELMALPPKDAWSVVAILSRAIAFDETTVLQLLDTYWLSDPAKDELSWRVLENVTVWRVDLVDRLCRIISRTSLAGWAVNHLASQISAQAPDLAPRLVMVWMQREWAERQAPDATDEQQRTRHYWLNGHDMHDLPAIAEAAPVVFINECWSWFMQVMSADAAAPHDFVVGYCQQKNYYVDIEDDPELRREKPFFTALLLAVEGFAHRQPEAFLAFVAANATLDLMIGQRLLAKGLIRIAAIHPQALLNFLRADPRRLVLGDCCDKHKNTKELISSVAPYLDNEQFGQLEQTIGAWSQYSHFPTTDIAKIRHNRLRYDREHRLRLLHALPRERLSEACRRRLREEERAFPNLKDAEVSISRMTRVGSPVSAEKMLAGSDENILGLFEELTDETAWDHPRRIMEGGAIQAGRELARLAEKDPIRAIGLIRRLDPQRNEIPVANVLEKLADQKYEPAAFYALVLELLDKGFDGEHFRHDVARALEKLVESESPLPDVLFKTLVDWLPLGEVCREPYTESKPDRHRSLLWGDCIVTLPHGNYPVLAALSAACLRTKPLATDRWLDVLEGHLARPDSPRVWAALLRYLKHLHLADHGRAQQFLKKLFATYPGIFETIEGVLLLAHSQRWITSGCVQVWFGRMAASESPQARQGMGELLTLRRVLFPAEEWVEIWLQKLVKSDIGDKLDGRDVRIGIAYAVGYLWREPQHSELIQPYLLQLLADPDATIQDALAVIFHGGVLQPGRFSRELLDTLCLHDSQLRRKHSDYMVQCLESIIDFEPERVFRVCSALLDCDGEDMSSFASARYLLGEPLVNIAFSLQELGGDYRALGTALFERLLEFNVAHARELLVDLDNRTCQGAAAVNPPRRRWRKKKTS